MVLLCDVQFEKLGFQNRTRIKTSQGEHWLTVPVITKGRFGQRIDQMEVNNRVDWRNKHLKTISQNYHKAPFFSGLFNRIESIYQKEWVLLSRLNMGIIYMLHDIMGGPARILSSLDLEIEEENPTQRLVSICQTLGADEYLAGPKGREYLELGRFKDAGIKVSYHEFQHPRYNQLYGEFIPYMSVIDLIFNHGPEAKNIILSVS